MTSLRPNLIKRIERLPKPTNAAGALLPLFEAVMNAIHSTQAKFAAAVTQEGRVTVVILPESAIAAMSGRQRRSGVC